MKADSVGRCHEVMKSVLKELEGSTVMWSEDFQGFRPDSGNVVMCPPTYYSSTVACSVACVPKVGNSYALFQKWDDDISTSKGKAKLVSNHAARMFGLDDEGKKLNIVRQTMRTGKLGSKGNEDKAGMLFVAYSKDPRIFDYMLDRMVGKRGSVEDNTLATTKCTRSQLFIVPSDTQVRSLANFH